MKLMKWMTVTALATATVFGSFVESAEARRGGSLSIESINPIELEFTFSLFTQTLDDEDIFDSKPRNQNVGVFEEAIENLSFIAEDCCGSSFRVSGEFDVLDLKARNRGRVVEYSFLLPLTGKEVFPTDQFFFDFQLPVDMIPQGIDPVNSLEDIFTLFNLRDDSGELLLQSLLIQENGDVRVSVPESNSINALLAMGSIGASLVLKRKLK